MIADLRQERRRQGLSLEQVSQRSRIPVQYLRALETGHYTDVPQGPFLDSYQRQYLEFLGAAIMNASAPRSKLGVDPDLARNKSAYLPDDDMGETTAEGTVDPNDDSGGRTRTITRQYDSVPVIRLILAGFLVTMALLLTMKLLSGFVDSGSGPDPAQGAITLVPADGRAAPPSPATEQSRSDTQAAPATLQPAAAPEPTDDELTIQAAAATPGMRVNLRAQERVQATVELDGTTVFSGWLAPGERQDFLAKDRIAINISDLTLVAIYYNGKRVDPLGNLTHPRRLVFLRDVE